MRMFNRKERKGRKVRIGLSREIFDPFFAYLAFFAASSSGQVTSG